MVTGWCAMTSLQGAGFLSCRSSHAQIRETTLKDMVAPYMPAKLLLRVRPHLYP